MEKKEEKELKIIHLRMYQVRKLEELKLSRGIFNTEGLMLILDKDYRTHDGSRMLFKYLDLQDIPEIMSNKTRLLSYLNNSPYKELEDLIIPEFQIYVNGYQSGFAMPLVEEHINLGVLLNSSRVPFERKKELLIKLGDLIDKVDRVESPNKMFFGDLNEYNFILNKDDELKAIDLDSSYVEGFEGINPPSLVYYLLKNKYLDSLSAKYKKDENGIFVPNMDSDLYSYNMIILNTLARHGMFKEDMDTYYSYLHFLEKLGVDLRLIESFMNIYTNKSNINPRLLLEEMDDSLGHRSSFKQFQKRR